MKVITVNQYVEVKRTLKICVEDNESVQDALKIADNTPLCLNGESGMIPIPEAIASASNWVYIEDTGWEDENGNEISFEDEGEVIRE